MKQKIKNSCDGIYSNSLDVRFTRACDNNCPFCIERKGIAEKGTDVEKLISATINSGKEDILILGGEPFLKIHELYQYIRGIRPYVKQIYVTTSLPETVRDNFHVFKNIMKLIDGLNVSLQHYLDARNNQILHSNRPYDRILFLKSICECLSESQKIRVCVNLVKGGIDDEASLASFLNKMSDIGITHVKINELQHEEGLFVSFERIFEKYLKENHIYMKSPYAHGCQRDIVLDNFNLKITVKRACFCVNSNLQATFPDFVKALKKKMTYQHCQQLVLYEDGTLSNGWQTH